MPDFSEALGLVTTIALLVALSGILPIAEVDPPGGGARSLAASSRAARVLDMDAGRWQNAGVPRKC